MTGWCRAAAGIAAAAALVLTLAACGQDDYPCEGTVHHDVTLDGAPATVVACDNGAVYAEWEDGTTAVAHPDGSFVTNRGGGTYIHLPD